MPSSQKYLTASLKVEGVRSSSTQLFLISYRIFQIVRLNKLYTQLLSQRVNESQPTSHHVMTGLRRTTIEVCFVEVDGHGDNAAPTGGARQPVYTKFVILFVPIHKVAILFICYHEARDGFDVTIGMSRLDPLPRAADGKTWLFLCASHVQLFTL